MSLKSIEPFVCGGIASCNAEIFTFPIDLAKVRLQIQGQRASSADIGSSKYRGMLHCLATVSREEGVSALYNG